MKKFRISLRTTILFMLILFTTSVFSFNVTNLHAQDNSETVSLQPTTLKTDNGSTEIQINSNDDLVAPDPISFFIEFRHPFSSMPLQHVNYDIEVVDSNNITVFTQENLHTHIGQDARDIGFENPGNYEIKIKVLGTGIDPPFDTTRTGTAIVPVTVN